MARKLYLLLGQAEGSTALSPRGVLGVQGTESFVSWLPGAVPGFLADVVASVTASAKPVKAAEELVERANGLTWDVQEVSDPLPGASLTDSVMAAEDELLATPGSM